LQLASSAPHRVTRLVLLSPAAEGVEPTADLQTFAQQEDVLLEAGDIDAATELNVRTWVGPEADGATRQRVREMRQQAFRIQLAAGDDVHAEGFEVDVAGINAATTVVSGQRDLDFFQAVARHLNALLPNARHIDLPWAGHLPSLERPDEITELIREEILWQAGRESPSSFT